MQATFLFYRKKVVYKFGKNPKKTINEIAFMEL